MRVFGAVVEIAVLVVLQTWENFPVGCAAACELVPDNHPWYVGQVLDQLAEKLLRGLLVPSALHEHIQHIAVPIQGAPQVMAFALNCQKYLIQVPFVARPYAPAAWLIGILLAELPAPLANGFIGHEDTTNEQQLFDIAAATGL
jgi:hypothetical protein